MSEEKHTPKRWTQGKKGNFLDVVFLVHWNESHGIPIDRNMWIDCNNAENASLIAAAPDLLEALVWMVENDDTNEGDTPIEEFGGASWNEVNAHWIAGLNKARAAIAKATGQTS